jgi:gas vesicle protein
MNKQTGNTLMAFLVGAATGALLGILYAPDKGSNTRDKLSFQLDKYKKKLESLLDEMISGKEDTMSVARSEGQKVVSEARNKAERLLEDVDDLIAQIKGTTKN